MQVNPLLKSDLKGSPVLGWTVDSFEQFYEAVEGMSTSLTEELKRYKKRSYDNKIRILFESAPFKLNLGGQTEKSKLVATDKTNGVFDFSLASRGLYRIPEYYSYELAVKYPNKFAEFELPSGVVPPNLIRQEVILGEKKYLYNDGNEVFQCVIRQKGETAVEEGIAGAKLKYGTRSKKVYLTYKRNKGKVRYVEIYSLFYYTSLSGDTQYAIRHIPAMMIAEYLESIGVMTRIYMTRFVMLHREYLSLRRYKKDTKIELPLYNIAPNKENYYNLFVQPIIVKEFGQEFDKELGFMVSSNDFNDTYQTVAKYSLSQEINNRSFTVFGDPDFSQTQYYEGFERYRNKYKEYVDLGIFKSKEVLPEAMLFFHDMAIKRYLNKFIDDTKTVFNNYLNQNGKVGLNEENILTSVEINPFFTWWMRTAANNLKYKIDLLNSNQLRKDLAEIKNEAYENYLYITEFVKNYPTDIVYRGETLAEVLQKYADKIMQEYSLISSSGNFSFNNYIITLTTEITTYAEGIFFPTEEETQEKRNEFVQNVLNELENI